MQVVAVQKLWVKFVGTALLLAAALIEKANAQQLGGSVSYVGNQPAWEAKAQSVETSQKSAAPQNKASSSNVRGSSWNPWSETKDGSPRGNVSMQKLNSDGTADNSYIFIYYDNFSVNKSMMGDVRCNVRFVVMTTLDRKLNSLSVRLKWPDMETPLNFQNVPPNVDAYQVYTLIGDGCYSMDKIPNIIVNRCRVAGLSSQSCTDKIRWLRKR